MGDRGEVVRGLTALERPVRVLYSYPQKIGAGRVCLTAWYQVAGLATAGAEVLAVPGAVAKQLPEGVDVRPTLARGRVRVPFRVFGGRRSLGVHDRIVARRLPKLADEIDIVHTWPMGARETLKTAAKLGIPTVLERPNAHTRFAYTVVAEESARLGVTLPPDHEHAYNDDYLRHEEEEYRLAYRLLCPSDFVARTFLDEGFHPEQLVRHQYGFDEETHYASNNPRHPDRPLSMLFVGANAVRKGLHYALEAWLQSPISERGRFLIAGEMLPSYGERLSSLLAHPSVRILGHRNDVAELMRASDLLVLPTIEEGSPLVCLEALASGCVPLASEVCTELRHGENALLHPIRDVDSLSRHMTTLDADRRLLERLRARAIETAGGFTWNAAGIRLLQAYREVMAAYEAERRTKEAHALTDESGEADQVGTPARA